MTINRDGYDVVSQTAVLGLVLGSLGWWAGGVWLWIGVGLGLFLFAFILYFFRDPERMVPEGDHLLISPADGKVLFVKRVYEPLYMKQEVNQISIFLSPMDVHVNRVPSSGQVEHAEYIPGKYLVAWHEKASELNERSEFGVRHPSGTPVFFRQITGYLARRITFHIRKGDRVKAGDRFGMMKLGSRMDILVPDNVELHVKAGDVTVAGETVMGVFR